jgi:MscS family membrane protein
MMAKPRLKEFKTRFHSASVLFFSTLLIVLQAALYLDRHGFINIPPTLGMTLRNVSVVIATLFITSLLIRLTIKRFFSLFDELEERIFYSKIYSWSLYSLGLFAILYHFGVSLGNITIFLGLIATGLAFAVRDVLLSFFGWMILLRKKPFRIGDYIRIDESEGKVIHIGTFYVLLDNTPELPQDYIRVPNRIFLEKSIFNLGKTKFHDRISFPLARLPENSDALIKELKDNIANLSEKAGYVSVYTDMQNERLLLIAEYLVSFENKQKKRSGVIQLVFKAFGEYLLIPKV